MKKTILIAPGEGALAKALCVCARGLGWSVALGTARRAGAGNGPSGERKKSQAPEAAGENAEAPTQQARADNEDRFSAAQPEPSAALEIAYNPASFISVSALVNAARAALGEIDVLALAGEPGSARLDFGSARPGDLGLLVEESCAGPLYLARECARLFAVRGSGSILLVAAERPPDAALSPQAALSAGAFEGLGEGLFAFASTAALPVFALLDASGQPDKAAAFALDLVTDARPAKAGRWLRFTGKSGFFGNL